MNRLQKPKSNYTVVDNRIHKLTELSVGARYIWIYLFGRPDDWEVKTSQLSGVLGYKAQTIRKMYRELIDAKLLSVERKNSGHCVYALHEITTGDIFTGEKSTGEKVSRLVSIERTLNIESTKNPCSNEFERWWLQYPKKVGKKKSKEIWLRMKPDSDVLIADTINRKENDSKWLNGYVKDPERYLKGELWNDELQQRNGNGEESIQPWQQYEQERERADKYFSKINGGAMGEDGNPVQSSVVEEQRAGGSKGIPRLGN